MKFKCEYIVNDKNLEIELHKEDTFIIDIADKENICYKTLEDNIKHFLYTIYVREIKIVKVGKI